VWEVYIKSLDLGFKPQATQALLTFLELMAVKAEMSEFVIWITDEHLFNRIKIDFRLFHSVVFPELLRGLKQKTPTYYRRMVLFEDWIKEDLLLQVHHVSGDTGQAYLDKTSFLLKELAINPNDTIAIEMILAHLKSQLNYATHELPVYGWVYPIPTFLQDLGLFKQYYHRYPGISQGDEWILYWESILNLWELFMEENEAGLSFGDYPKKYQLVFPGPMLI